MCAQCCQKLEANHPAGVQEQEPRLPMLLKMLLWAHKQLQDKVSYPSIPNLVTGELSVPAEA